MAAPSEEELAAARASGSGRAALGQLPDGYPAPRFRLVLRDVNVRTVCPPNPQGSAQGSADRRAPRPTCV